ncbi:MAG: glycine cleavage system aminomethyltransferase GcvT [Rhabdochlamydiaceae bacterium]|nr:glycine cleavage system aminomethyltransferase GcvT [Rhabdochlamydiaceae bacterium]
MQNTPFFQIHIVHNAKMTPFSGYNMPLHYGSQIEEHEAVRRVAGMFDVSHMMITDVEGLDARAFLRKLLANDVAKLEKVGNGKAHYSLILNDNGGIIDDVIVYLMPFGYRIVSNAGTRSKVKTYLAHTSQEFQVTLKERSDFAMLAIQGPQAIEKVLQVKPSWREQISQLKRFQGCEVEGFFIARTGYTGEEGLEIMIPLKEVEDLWKDLFDVGVAPCGLAARDTLRLEAGMNLYGQDMDETTNPLEAGFSWCIDLEDLKRNFIGQSAILSMRERLNKKQVGLLLLGAGVMRAHQAFRNSEGAVGLVTSGTFSPSLKQSIAMASVPIGTGELGEVEIRGTWQPVKVVALPFIKKTATP